MISYIAEWNKHIHKRNMAEVDQICEVGNTCCEVGNTCCEVGNTCCEVGNTCCEDGNTCREAVEQPEGILQLIDKLENIVDQLLPG